MPLTKRRAEQLKNGNGCEDVPRIKTPMARVLSVLASGRALTRPRMAMEAGFTPVSGTITRVLNGLREGSSSGAAHLGIVAMGLVRVVELDIDGLAEVVHQITEKGKAALDRYYRENGPLPELKDRGQATNRRYR